MVGLAAAVAASWMVASLSSCGAYMLTAKVMGRGESTFGVAVLVALLTLFGVLTVAILALT
jgi:hypothetical protein